ncbi:phage integrase N-terminal SAM-like domain-containing protein [Microvirga ossetica]|uniref:phage integrase N-terminal SAM-like domain-containing protein n=1 Tax=Microvirga ossetica TaxID=1882682 RepID=UPI001F0323F7|nr:phage integrase N-terminal SAM-like domain-containing protein [Microvirga ossetica]
MAVRHFVEKTRTDYIRHVRSFAAFLGRSPETASPEDVRHFQLHLTESGVTPPSCTRRLRPCASSSPSPSIGRIWLGVSPWSMSRAKYPSSRARRKWGSAQGLCNKPRHLGRRENISLAVSGLTLFHGQSCLGLPLNAVHSRPSE